MNYIGQIKAFYDRLEENSLSTSAIALWHALMYANNKAGWTDEFSVAASLLCFRTGLAERTISKARNELKQKGFIDFRSRRGNRSAVYKIEDLSAYSAGNRADKRADNHADSHAGKRATLVSPETKPNETKQQTAVSRSHWFDTYYQCFGQQPSPIQCEKIIVYLEQDGISDEAICKAFRIAAEVGKSYGYAVGILNNWATKGIKTLADVRAEQKKHQQTRKQATQSYTQTAATRQEVVPAWMKQEHPKKEPDVSPEEVEKRAAELDKFFNSF